MRPIIFMIITPVQFPGTTCLVTPRRIRYRLPTFPVDSVKTTGTTKAVETLNGLVAVSICIRISHSLQAAPFSCGLTEDNGNDKGGGDA